MSYPRWEELSSDDREQSAPIWIDDGITKIVMAWAAPVVPRVRPAIATGDITICPRCGSEKTNKGRAGALSIRRYCTECRHYYTVREVDNEAP